MASFSKAAAQVLLIMIASPALADEGASGLYVPGNFGFGAGVTPDPDLYLSTGLALDQPGHLAMGPRENVG